MPLQDFTGSCPAAEPVGQKSLRQRHVYHVWEEQERRSCSARFGSNPVCDFKVNQAASKKINLELASLRWELKWLNPVFRIQDMNQSQRWIWDWFMSYITETEKCMDYTPSRLQGAIHRFRLVYSTTYRAKARNTPAGIAFYSPMPVDCTHVSSYGTRRGRHGIYHFFFFFSFFLLLFIEELVWCFLCYLSGYPHI